MPSLSTAWTVAVAALAVGVAPSVLAQDPSSSSSAHSSAQSTAQRASSSLAAPSSSASSAPAATGSPATASNPLIPASVSQKCQSFLTALNSNDQIAQCTAPLLTTVAAFHASSSSADSYSASSSQVQSALTDLCSAPGCDDALLRSLLGQFNGNCSQELQAANQVVLGSYDALYVLSPLRNAVCTRDESGGFCLDDIAQRSMPASSSSSSTGTNATSSIVSSSSVAAVASASSSSSTTKNSTTTNANATAPATPKQNFAVLAAADTGSDYSIPVPAPPSLYIQISSAARRLLRRQWSSGGAASSSSSSSSAAAAASSSAAATAPVVSLNEAGVHAFDVPSILPDAQTWSTSNLPFLFLSPNMTSSVLCSSCTKQILAAYVAWESRMPYALGLTNSPLLSGQGDLWTGLGQVCGTGFLQAVTQQAGEANLAGGALASVSRVGGAAVVGLASLVAFALYL
ncbi:hypothetical protein JCM8115_001813 [Rhodotorula mucilaginosa]|uniref:DUF7729 domain-containing protein n=1 Tax=Rhodotorula mucilaginosa TaxID=5537 RepID=A0A9P6VYJ7_RHOMI|nr:hypothetical protein C6P46_006529 [Rhodotorula mucilaginosa]